MRLFRPLLSLLALSVLAAPGLAVTAAKPLRFLVQMPVTASLAPGASPSVSAESVNRLAAAVPGAHVVRTFQHVHWQVVEVPAGTDGVAALAKLTAALGTGKVVPDFRRHATVVPNDPSYSSQYNMTNISAPTAWNTSTGSSNVVVGVVDTGIDFTHPDLAANLWTNPNANASDGYNGADVHGIRSLTDDNNVQTLDGNADDDNGHGSHVSGIIGAVGNNSVGVAGVNWHVQLMALKFLDSTGSGVDSDAITCIDYAISEKQKGVNVVALNSSWGGSDTDPALTDAFNAAATAGIVCPCAAGNGDENGNGVNNDTTPTYPANSGSSTIISVAASDSGDNRAGFSNYGPKTVDLAAPGVGILSTVLNGQYDYYDGTSMATPHVTGAAALIAAVNPGLSAALIKARIEQGVDLIPAWSGLTITGGRLNLAKCLVQGPTITAIANQTVHIPGNSGALPFTIGSNVTNPANLQVSAVSSNQSVVPNSGISIVGTSANNTITVTPSASGTATITITVVDGNGIGTTTNFLVTATSATVPSLSVANTTATVGSSGSTNAAFLVTLSASQTTAVSVQYATANGTAIAGTDYTATSGTLTFAAGQTSATVSVAVLGNNNPSGRTFSLVLSNPSGASIGTGTATCTIAHNNAPTAVSLTPLPLTSAAGTYQLMTATFNDPNGAANISSAAISVGSPGATAASLIATYNPINNTLSLRGGGAYTGSFAPGSANVIMTSLGSLDCSKTKVTFSGTQLQVVFSLAPASGLVGTNVTYLNVYDKSGPASGWTSFGNWTVTQNASGPVAQSLTGPSTTPVGSTALFTSTFSDTDSGGVANFSSMFLVAGPPANSAASLQAQYNPVTNQLSLRSGNSYIGYFAPGSSHVIAAPLGSLDCSKTTVTVSGNQLQVVWAIIPASGLQGTQPLYLNVYDKSGHASGFKGFGNWIVGQTLAVPVNTSLAGPSSLAAGSPGSFVATYTDSSGASKIASAHFVLGSLSNPSASIQAQYIASSNTLSLRSGSSYIGNFTPGSSHVITTSLGSLDCSKTTVTLNGTQLQITWSVTPASGLIGTQPTYLNVYDTGNQSPAWKAFANCTVTGVQTTSVTAPSGVSD